MLLNPIQFQQQVHMERMLGAGAAGTVYQGSWRGRPVAVKILHPSRQTSPSAVEGFRRELEVMARVGTHPGIISVLAACTHPPHLAIVAELAAGGSLHHVLHEMGYLPRYGTLLTMAEDIARAIAHCHSLRLVHRDLKSHNVLLDSAGKARLADFGLSLTRHGTFLTLEQGGAALGTAAFMAPEQFAAHQVSERCDSFAFGGILWELITGKQMWGHCTNLMQIVMAVGCERRRPPLPAGCPQLLARLIQECWRHNPALRPGFPEIVERLRGMRAEDATAPAMHHVGALHDKEENEEEEESQQGQTAMQKKGVGLSRFFVPPSTTATPPAITVD